MARWRCGRGAIRSAAAVLLLPALSGTIPALTAEPARLPEDYWRLPLPPQGEAPQAWPESERSLRPEKCGACHAERYAEWQSSLHAKGFSPGLLGQLLTFDPTEVDDCLDCHAPLAEQKQAFAARLRGAAMDDPALVPANRGNSCAGCHVRAHRRFGPPARVGHDVSTEAGNHGGVQRTTEFEDSAFCSACHQFPATAAVNGKPLENTYVEWRESEFAGRGQSCQSCHMPDRQHRWRGIHDPTTVASGLTSRIAATPDGVQFIITNTGVGHYFPTYSVPRVAMRAAALDNQGEVAAEPVTEYVIQRVVEYNGSGWHEISDTRLAPGAAVALRYQWRGYRRVRVWLEVYPDDFYRQHVYPDLLKDLEPASPAARLLRIAADRAAGSSYRLFETIVERPN